MNRVPIRELAPKAWDAICDLTGGADRIAGEAPNWGDGFMCNFIACDSVPVIARHLHAHPEGLMPNQFRGLTEQCTDFTELTGETGDVVLLHPFVLHAASQNPSGRPRFITNPCISLKEPMDFNPQDPADFSPIEQAVLKGLGIERLDYQITGERKRLTPEREKRQQQMLEEQQKRLEAAHARA